MNILRNSLFFLVILPLTLFPGYASAVKLFKLSLEDTYYFKTNLEKGTPGEIGLHLTNARLRGPLYGNSDRALGFLLGYEVSNIDWDKNVFFSQEDFHNLELGIQLMCRDVEHWQLRGGISGVFDLDNGSIGSSNTLYKGMLWGIYDYSKSLDFHLGLLCWTGLLDNNIFPILGWDWRASEHWIVSLVFPLKIGIEYLVDDRWSVILRPRVEINRHQLSENEQTNPRGFFEYRNFSGELAIKYEKNETWNAIFFGGWCGGGSIQVWDSARNNADKREFNSGPHIGASGTLNF
jgi:hypothetical protein